MKRCKSKAGADEGGQGKVGGPCWPAGGAGEEEVEVVVAAGCYVVCRMY